MKRATAFAFALGLSATPSFGGVIQDLSGLVEVFDFADGTSFGETSTTFNPDLTIKAGVDTGGGFEDDTFVEASVVSSHEELRIAIDGQASGFGNGAWSLSLSFVLADPGGGGWLINEVGFIQDILDFEPDANSPIPGVIRQQGDELVASEGGYRLIVNNPNWESLVFADKGGFDSTWTNATADDYELTLTRLPSPLPAGVLAVDASATGSGAGTSWENALTQLCTALAIAADPANQIAEIRVAAGRYAPAAAGGPRDASLALVDGVTIYGGFPTSGSAFEDRDPVANLTILTGDLNGDDFLGAEFNDDNSFSVLTAGSSVGQTTRLDGFVITGGNADGKDLASRGGGLFVNGGHPSIHDCRFIQNSAVQGAGVSCERGSPTFVRCTISDNAAETVGGGMQLIGGASPILYNCRITANTSSRSTGVALGGLSGPGNPTFVNTLIAGNTATAGDGAAVNGIGNPTFINCTVVENAALLGNIGGIRTQVGGSVATIQNSIVWNNTDSSGRGETAQLGTAGGAMQSVNHSCIDGWTDTLGGVGNIGLNPEFVDADVADYRLLGASPCIDAADTTAVPADVVDLDGDTNVSERVPLDLGEQTRFTDRPETPDTGVPDGVLAVVDMGAFENDPQPCPTDFDGDGTVGFTDLTRLLGAWGSCPGCPEDVAQGGDGFVGFEDLTFLLGTWGSCA